MTTHVIQPPVVIVCPLRFEARALQRAGLVGVRIEVCGPGQEAVQRWSERTGAWLPRGTLVILAGVAAGISLECRPGEAMWVDEVVVCAPDETGGADRSAGVVRIAHVDTMLASVEAKRTVHRATRATLADMESRAMQECAQAHGWELRIIRGISDGPNDAIPRAIGHWVDHRGRMRLSRVARDLLLHPWWLPRVVGLGRISRIAMGRVAREIELQLRAEPTGDVRDG